MKFNFLYKNLEKEFAAIESELQIAVLSSEAETIRQAAKHLLDAGGKRIRPLFVCLCAHLGKTPDFEETKQAATAIELIHMASIVHDDVVDDAEVRRGRSAIKAKWGNHIAMYTGDFLFAKSLEYMTNLSEVRAHNMLSRVTVELAVGEIEQIRDQYNFNQSVRTYLRRIKRKTALLIATSCGLGGIISGLADNIDEKLYRFGYYVGMNFQINDDILDFMADEEKIGKPAGGDLLQGNITLPVFFAMRDSSLCQRIKHINAHTKPAEMSELITAIKKSGAIQEAERVAENYLSKAVAILDELEQTKAIKPLKQIVKVLDKRAY